MELNKPMLTVVVPAYNVEKYLAECLDSLVEQTVCDHRIIIVNDGSKDSTEEIAKAYAARYPQLIRYVAQENQGLGAARNTGLALADTEYVAFLDSDDWWDRLFVEKLKAQLALHEQRPDLIFSLPWIYDQVTKKLSDWFDKEMFENIFFPGLTGEDNPASRMVNAEQDKRLFELEFNACRRIYRLEFLRQEAFAFPVGVKWEDVQPHFHLLHKARHCIGLGATGFFYRTNSGGQITASRGAARLDMLRVFADTLNMSKQQGYAREERAYIVNKFWGFAKWCIFVVDSEYMMPLLKGLHKLMCTISSADYKAYYAICPPDSAMDKVLILIMRSPFYWLMKDYLVRRMGVHIWDRIQKIIG